jgi:hypothetical protein
MIKEIFAEKPISKTVPALRTGFDNNGNSNTYYFKDGVLVYVDKPNKIFPEEYYD